MDRQEDTLVVTVDVETDGRKERQAGQQTDGMMVRQADRCTDGQTDAPLSP